MARAKKTRRGSPEAIAKRRAARSLNRIFIEGATVSAMDGRTLKRKKRLIKELQEGKRGQPLKAHEVLSHATELMTLGENLTTLRRLKPRLPATPPLVEPFLSVVRETQKAYSFDPRAWRLLGIDIEKVMSGAVSAEAEDEAKDEGEARRPRKRSSRKKKAA
ncbi:MAG TPA: hypothetical protein VIL20_24885 [Sandaracinaceae bacterium]